MVNQRCARAVSKGDLRFGDPFSDDRRELSGRDAVTAIIVDEVAELGLPREPYELFSTIVFIDPSITRLGTERQSDGFADGRLGSEMLGPHHGAALAAVTENNRRPRAHNVRSIPLNVAPAHVFIQKLHHRVHEGVRSRVAEIVFGHRPVAVRLLGWSGYRFAARKHQA